MSRIRLVQDDGEHCYASVTLDNGQEVWLSVSNGCVTVKRLLWSSLGPQLYAEADLGKAVVKAVALAYAFEDDFTPPSVKLPPLKAFLNAVLHCRTADEVETLLNRQPEDLPMIPTSMLGEVVLLAANKLATGMLMAVAAKTLKP